MKQQTMCFWMFLLWAHLAVGSLDAQVIKGSLVPNDQTDLNAVAVVLFDDTFQRLAAVRPEGSGHFSFTALEPGEYLLMVERPGHASIVSPPLRLRAGDTVMHRFRRDVPSLAELRERSRLVQAGEAFLQRVSTACGEDDDRKDAAILAGTVRDTVSGLALPGVDVVLRWNGVGGEEQISAQTDADGDFILCEAPSEKEIVLSVQGLGRSEDLLGATLEPGTAHHIDIPIDPPAAEEEPGQIVGRVLEYETGRGVSEAEVRLGRDGRMAAVTNSRGYFSLRDVPPGSHTLSVEHIGYGTQERSFVVLPARAHEIEVRLATKAIELEPIHVTVRSQRWLDYMEGLEYRMNKGFGHFLLQEDIAMRGPNVPVGLLLDGLPGVDWRRRRGYDAAVMVRDRCKPAVWVDGVQVRIPIFGPDGIRSSDIEAIEVYTFPGSVPAEFGGGLECASIVIWTRH